MKETFEKYDAADYLDNEEDILMFLNEVAAISESPKTIAHALGVAARARARNMSQLARDSGISREGLYKALSDKGNPSLETVLQVSRALGFRLAFQAAA